MNRIIRKYLNLLLGVLLLPIIINAQQKAEYNTGNCYIHKIGEKCVKMDFANSSSGIFMNNGSVWFLYDFENNGTVNYLSDKEINLGLTLFESESKQYISGTGSTRFYNVMFNNSAVDGFSLEQDIVIANTAHLTKGIIHALQTNVESFENVVIMEDASSYETVSDSCHVDGFVVKVGNSNFTFPIGNEGYYRYAAISAPSVETDSFAARYVNINPNDNYSVSSKADDITQISSTEYWIVDRISGTSDVDVTLSWDTEKTSDNSLDYNNVAVVRWDGSQWINEGRTASTINGTEGEVTASVSAYGVFTFGVVDSDVNDPPLAVNDSVEVYQNSVDNTGNVLDNDSDPDGDAISVTGFTINGVAYEPGEKVELSGYGEFTLNADGTWSFTPESEYIGRIPDIVYTITDGEYSDEAVLVIEVVVDDDTTVIIPNIFSPNGDNIKDLFKIKGLGNYPEAKILIFSRWGTKVYEKDAYGNTSRWGTTDAWWNGSSNQDFTFNGDKLPAATYFYVLKLGNGQNYSGFVYLNR